MILLNNVLTYNQFSFFKLILFCTALSLIGCQQHTQPRDETVTLEGKQQHGTDEMQAKNGELIDQVIATTRSRILNKQMDLIIEDADTVMLKYIGVWELQKHFWLTEQLYGSLTELKDFYTNMTATAKRVDMVAVFDKGDSLQLTLGLNLYDDYAKVAYLGFSFFNGVPVQKEMLEVFDPIATLIANKQTEAVYAMCTEKYKETTSFEEMNSYFERNIPSKSVAFEIGRACPLIFDRAEVGYSSVVSISSKTQEFQGQSFGLKLVVDPETDELKIGEIKFFGDQS